jgi:6-phosphogluconolactonase (cycloisomerase 2 family)
MAMVTENFAGPSPGRAKDHGLVFVGSFTTAQRKARGEGIHVYRRDPQSGAWIPTDHVGDLVNPSFLTTDPVRQVLYVVHGDGDYVSAFGIEASNGKLRAFGRADAGGLNGVHQALDPSGKFLIVANYASGTVAVLPVQADGALRDFVQLVELPGAVGPHRTEQKISHPHHIVFDPSGHFVLVPDKGLDRVFVLKFDPQAGRLEMVSHATMRPGAGPRHMVFHPKLPIAFVVNEIDSTVATCGWDAERGVLSPLSIAPCLPPEFFGASTTAAIVITPAGDTVYVSNRGQDGITQLRFNPALKRLDVVGWTHADGSDPRFMTLNPSGDRLIVATEQGDCISEFKIAADGHLTPDGDARHVKSPCTIAFL